MLRVAVALGAIGETVITAAPPDKALYEAHSWLELRDALANAHDAPLLYRCAVAAAFNEEAQAKTLLKTLIRSHPSRDDLYEANTMLEHLLLDSGQYQRFGAALTTKARAFPERAAGDLKEYGAFAHLPNQKLEKSERSILHHNGDLWVPLIVNNLPASYFLDTGAVTSAMSESEAKRLAMVARNSNGEVGISTGSRVGFRLAVARELTVGGSRFRNVSFLVFPDNEAPWSSLSPGRRGLLGVPVLLGLGALKWSKNGTIELGGASKQ